MTERQNKFELKSSFNLRVLLGIVALFMALAITFLCLWLNERQKYAKQTEELNSLIKAQSDYYDPEKLANVFSIFDAASLKPFPSKEDITDAMIKSFVGIYGDPWATYFTKQEAQSWSDRMSGSYYGIGVVTGWEEGLGIKILFVMNDSPAQEAGLLAGDIICRIDGQSAVTIGQKEAPTYVVGDAGTKVTLGILRGTDEFDFELTRRAVTNQSVIYKKLENEPSIGYIRITGFDSNTFSQFQAAVSSLKNDGVTSLIYDLRDNGGGTLYDVCAILAYILPDGDLAHINYPDGSGKTDYSIWAKNDILHYGDNIYQDSAFANEISLPCTVLINSNTASAAELFTSALRDYAAQGKIDAVTVGTKTYGKGVMQTTYSLSGGCSLKLTVAYYNPPCGINYDGIGITPDYTETLSEEAALVSIYELSAKQDTQLAKAIWILKQ